MPNTATPFFGVCFRRANGSFQADPLAAVDAYLAERGLWGDVKAPSADFSFTKFYAGLCQNRRLTPAQVGDMTLSEALLYTVSLEEKESTTRPEDAFAKLRVLSTLTVNDHLALARIRCGR